MVAAKEATKTPIRAVAAIRRFGNGAGQIGLRFDRKNGVLSGTPTKAGIHIVQIRVARNPGRAASDETYVLKVAVEEKKESEYMR